MWSARWRISVDSDRYSRGRDCRGRSSADPDQPLGIKGAGEGARPALSTVEEFFGRPA